MYLCGTLVYIRTTDPQVLSLNTAVAFVFMNEDTFLKVEFVLK